MKRRALGKGLESLLPQKPAMALEAEGYIQVGVDEVVPNPGQPREVFEEEELRELADSIRSAGVLQPILVRRADSGGYELIAGERRLRAARMAGLERVPARLQSVGQERSLEMALIENIQRQQLNPVEEAQAFSVLIEQHGLTQEEVAKQVGRKRSSIANSLRLLKLPARVQTLLKKRLLTAGHAKALLSLEDEHVILEAAETLAKGLVTVRAAEQMARENGRAGPRPAKRFRTVDPNVQDAELRLQRALATKVRIKKNGSGRGRIEIEFHSDEELQRLFELLEGRMT